MESREGAMLEAAAALLSARHAIPASGTSTMLSGTSIRGSVAPAAAWPSAPSGSGSEHTLGHERGQHREGTPSHPLRPIEAMMQWTYPVGCMREEAPAEQRSSRVHGMSQQAPHEIGQPQVVSQHEQQRQELIHQRLQEKQQLLQQQSMQQQQQLQQQRLYQQQQHLYQQQRQQQHELRHQQRTEHQNISSREPLPQHQDHQPQQSQPSQQSQPFQASRVSQASQQPHLASRQTQQPSPQQQQRQPKKQQKSKHKRKNESNQRREIDDILALAEPQPEFARPQYRAQFEQAPVLSQDEAQARRSASAVIRPGQSIVPQTYQRRPVETNLRLRAMSRMTGSSMGDGSQNARSLPAARTMALSDVIAAAASSGVTQRLPAPAFSSTTEQSKLTGGVWPQQHQASSHLRQQPLQHVRIEGLRTPQETLFRTLQSPHTQQQQQVASQPGRRILPDLDRFIHQGFHRQTSEQSNDKRNPDIPKDLRAQGQDEWSQTILPSHSTQMQGHVSRMQPSPAVQLDRGHSLSNQHYYMAPPHQPLRLEPRFQDSMWKYPERSSAAANQVDSNLQGNVQLTARAFVAETAPYSASANSNSLLPSLDIWSDKDSNWYYPSAASKKKTNASQKIKISAGHTVNLSQLAVQNDLKQLDKGVVASGSQSLGSTGTLISGMGVAHKRPTGGYTTEAPSAGPSDGMPPSDAGETKLTGSRVLALPGKAMSNNRLRRMVKQNRRLQRQEMAKKEREKQVDAVQMAPQQSLPVERPRAQLQQGPKQPRLSQTSRRTENMARPQQQMQDERVREVDFAMRSKIVSATSSSQSTTTPRHADFRDYLAPKTALQREHEELLRRAQLVMAAQQQLHQRNHRDAFPHARPFPTVVARSAAASSGPPAHKRSRGEFEQQNAGVYDSTPDICLPPQSPSYHENNGTNETSCQADDSTISEPGKSVMGRQKDMKTSEVCSTNSNERADVNQISAPSNAVSADAPVNSLSCDVPATDVVKANRVPRSERPTKTRKRKASSLLHAATLAATAGVATADSAPLPPDTGTGVVVPQSDSCLPETETVMIFCKRDFMRFQTGLLWKKYQEIKRKRDQTLATVTGRRARYLNARYKSSNEENGTVELGRPRKRGLKRASRSSTLEGVGDDPAPAQEVEVLDNEDGASSGIGIGLGSHRSGDSEQVNPSETDAMDSLQDESGNPESCGATFREATAGGEEGHARFVVTPSDAREHGSFLGDDDRTDPSGEDVRATSDETLPAQSEGDERKAPAAAGIEPREGCGPNDAQMLVMSIDASPSLPLEERIVRIASTVDTDCCQEADLQQETVPVQVPGDDGSPAMATSPPSGSIRDARSVEDKASGGGNSEYVIIEEDTFGDWSCVGTHVSPATPDTTKRSPLPSPESNTGECLPPEAAVADSGGERFLAHESQAETSTMETKRRTAADVPASLAFQMATVTAVTTTFPIMTMPVTIQVFPHEMPRGSYSKTNDNTADNEGAGIVFREECLI